MSKAKRYTLETLLPLNVSYDSDHGLTQEDVDMVNSLVEVIESTRSKHTPKIGDRVVYTQKGGATLFGAIGGIVGINLKH